MMIFVVGPSGVGKTTLLNRVLPEFPTLRLLDLDAEEERCERLIRSRGGNPGGWEGRWRRNLESLRSETIHPGDSVIVDVGAGSLETIEGRLFFIERGRSAIVVMAPWQVVHERRHPGRDPEEFQRTEYSSDRQSVYQAARFKINSSGAIQESAAQFRLALQELLDRHLHR